ncbi:MAG: lipopolysaccharide heptosyltransferase II [Candidatus Omnitrophica bacterium]|nr:lipopolysaccharide heptosyltransferase II [Candidatus Omnitrophota bacterium]
MNPKKRILIFNVNWLGDVLFSTATIRNIKRNFPESFIACVIPIRCYPVLKGNPHIDEIIIFDEKDRHKGVLGKLKFIRLLKSKRFDTVFLLHRSFTRALICKLAGIPERIGYFTKKRGFLLSKKIIAPSMEAMHRIDYYLNIIEKAGLKLEDRYLEFFVSDGDREFVDNYLNRNSVNKNVFLVAINPGSNWSPKRWPTYYWAELADKLISAFNAKVIITGSVDDIVLAKAIRDSMKEKPMLVCGIFNLKQLAALCKRLGLFITADTGPLHIANAVGTKKIIALFGPTSANLTGPYPGKNAVVLFKDVGCRIPCYKVFCKDNRCMKAITPEDIINEVRKLVN